MALWSPSPNMHHGRKAALRWVVWHSTESSEVKGGAYNVAVGWFGKRAAKASAHIVADNGADQRYPDGIVECVRPQDTAWHAARANASGYGIEIIGRAGQGGDAWSDPYSLAAIRNACRWVRAHPQLTHIPPRWLTDAQLRAGERGHITHAQVSRVLGGTDHTDPGTGFPFAFVMEQLKGGDSGSTTWTPTGTTLRPGYSGRSVELLQAGLNRVFPSYSQLVVDGDFGPATEAVVKQFQRRSGLVADGVVGPLTWEALRRVGIG